MNMDNPEKYFPKKCNADVAVVMRELDLRSAHKSYHPFKVIVQDEKLTIPGRIYSNKNQLDKIDCLSEYQQLITYCIYSRHHNGYIREMCLKRILESKEPFVAPFILQLLSEYVFEIIDYIFVNRERINKGTMKSFIDENADFYYLVHQRIYSYWDCYYRRSYPKYRKNIKYSGNSVLDYPGIKMLDFIRNKLLIKK